MADPITWLRRQVLEDARDIPQAWVRPMLVGLTALGLALRLYHLGRAPLWIDEIYTWDVTNFAFSTVAFTFFDTNPPVYWIIEWLVTRAGNGAALLRLSSALAGTATIPAVYVLAHRLIGRLGGLAAALFITTSSVHLWYSQNARPGALQLLLLILAAIAFLRVIDAITARPTVAVSSPRAALLAYACLSILALYTHFSTAPLIAVANLVVLPIALRHQRSNRDAVIGWLLANSLIALAAVPFLILTASGAGVVTNWVTQVSAGGALLIAKRILVSAALPSAVAALALVVPLAGFLAALISGRRSAVLVIATAVAALPLCEWLIGFAKPLLLERTALFVLVGGAVAVGAVLVLVRNRVVVALLLAIFAGGQAMAFVAFERRPDDSQYRSAALYMASHVRPGEAVLECEPYPVYFSPDHDAFVAKGTGTLHEFHPDRWFAYNALPIAKRTGLSPEQVRAIFLRDRPDIRVVGDLVRHYRVVWFHDKHCLDLATMKDFGGALAHQLKTAGYRAGESHDWGGRLTRYEQGRPDATPIWPSYMKGPQSHLRPKCSRRDTPSNSIEPNPLNCDDQ